MENQQSAVEEQVEQKKRKTLKELKLVRKAQKLED